MKKILAMLLVVAMVFSMVGCGEKEPVETQAPVPAKVVPQTEAPQTVTPATEAPVMTEVPVVTEAPKEEWITLAKPMGNTSSADTVINTSDEILGMVSGRSYTFADDFDWSSAVGNTTYKGTITVPNTTTEEAMDLNFPNATIIFNDVKANSLAVVSGPHTAIFKGVVALGTAGASVKAEIKGGNVKTEGSAKVEVVLKVPAVVENNGGEAVVEVSTEAAESIIKTTANAGTTKVIANANTTIAPHEDTKENSIVIGQATATATIKVEAKDDEAKEKVLDVTAESKTNTTIEKTEVPEVVAIDDFNKLQTALGSSLTEITIADDIEVTADLTVSSLKTLTIPAETTLTVASGVTITNYGTIEVCDAKALQIGMQANTASGTVKVLNDITLDENEGLHTFGNYKSSIVANFNGILDGNSKTFDINISQFHPIIETLTNSAVVTIKDLNIRHKGPSFSGIIFMQNVGATLTFKNVVNLDNDSSAEMLTGNNGSPFIAHAYGTITFDGCVNNESYVDTALGYSSMFIGGMVYSTTTATFIDCICNGSLTGGDSSLFIGNSSSGKGAKVKVIDCVNNGKFIGTSSAELFSKNGGNTDFDSLNNDEEIQSNVTGTGEFIKLNTGTYNVINNEIVINKLDDAAYYVVTLRTYATTMGGSLFLAIGSQIDQEVNVDCTNSGVYVGKMIVKEDYLNLDGTDESDLQEMNSKLDNYGFNIKTAVNNGVHYYVYDDIVIGDIIYDLGDKGNDASIFVSVFNSNNELIACCTKK